MKQLTNYCPVMGYEKQIDAYPGKLKGYLDDNKLQGVELNVYADKPYEEDFRGLATGVHLRYWPMWLEFWNSNGKNLPDNPIAVSYAIKECNNEEWLQTIRRNIKAAIVCEPEYLVWHVSDCLMEEIYYRHFKHSDADVIEGTIEVFNEIVDVIPPNVQVLFENLWWPGLTLKNPAVAERLLTGVKHKNVGFMLDTGHLMNTNWQLTTEQEAVKYVIETAAELGELKCYIKGLHLSCSLSGEYQRGSVGEVPKSLTIGELMKHIGMIDEHKVFQQADLRPLIEFIEPEYVNHELYYDTMEHLSSLLKIQQAKM